jgi:hypothetical protein
VLVYANLRKRTKNQDPLINMEMRTLLVMSILFLMIVGILPASGASNLMVGSKDFTAAGEIATIDLYLDTAPDGLVGGIYLIHLQDDSVARITDIKFPPWVLLNANSSNMNNDVWLKILAQPAIPKGSSNVYLGSVVVTAQKAGNTPITVQLSNPADVRNLKYWLEDVNGNVINVMVIPGMITVRGSGSEVSSTIASPSGSTTVPLPGITTVKTSGSITSSPSGLPPGLPANSTTPSGALSMTSLPSTPGKSPVSLPIIFMGGVLGALLYIRTMRKNAMD